MKANRCSANSAIEALMQLDEKELHHEGKGKREPCIIDGVTYSSRGAACKAYGVKYVSVHSRMKRDGLSLKKHCPLAGLPEAYAGTESCWGSIHLFPFTPDQNTAAALCRLAQC